MFGEAVGSELGHWRQELASLWKRVRSLWFLYPLSLFVALRVWLSLWVALITDWMPLPVDRMRALYYGVQPLELGLGRLVWGPWQRWDTMWYLKIAERGYSTSDLGSAFFPLYPILIKAATPLLGNNDTAAAVIIASIAALASFVLLYRLVADRFGIAVARRTLLLLAAFPTAYFLFAGYTESLFLALALGALLTASNGRWGLAGLLGGLAALTRPQGALYIFVLIAEFVLQYREHRVTFRQAGYLLFAGLGTVAFPLYLMLQFGNPLFWFRVEGWWHRSALPWDTLRAGVHAVLGAKNWSDVGYSLPDLFFAILFIALLAWSIVRLRPTFTLYMAIIILPPLLSISTFQPLLPLASFSRYVLIAFPGLFLLGSSQRVGRYLVPIVILSFLVQMILLSQFVGWHFVE